MTAQTFTANVVARLVAKRTGRPCDAKRVRSWARANVTRFDDDGYTTHAYTSAERDRIVNALVARSRANATGTDGRASSASRGRTAPTAPKGRAKGATAPKPSAKPSAPLAPSDAGTGDATA